MAATDDDSLPSQFYGKVNILFCQSSVSLISLTNSLGIYNQQQSNLRLQRIRNASAGYDFSVKMRKFCSFSDPDFCFSNFFFFHGNVQVQHVHVHRAHIHQLNLFVLSFSDYEYKTGVRGVIFTLSFHLSCTNAPQRKTKFYMPARDKTQMK